MAEERGNESGGGIAPVPTDLRRLAVAWGTATLIVAATVAVAGLTYLARGNSRADELDRYYARAVARESEHFALRFANYRQLVDSITKCSADEQSTCDLETADRALQAARKIAADQTDAGLIIDPCPSGARWGEPILEEVAGVAYIDFPPSRGRGALDVAAAPGVCGKVALADFIVPHHLHDAKRTALQEATGLDDVLLFRDDRMVALDRDHDGGLGLISLPAAAKSEPLGAQVLPKVKLGAANVRLYLRQVDVDVHSSKSAQVTFTVAGLIDEERLALQTRMIPPGTFYWAVLLVGLGGLSLPLAKLWLLGRRSRLRRIDVACLATAAVVAVLLSSILFLAAVANNRLGARLDARLKSVAVAASGRLRSRVETGAQGLDGFVTRVCSSKGTATDVRPETKGFHGDAWGPPELRPSDDVREGIPRLNWTAAFLAHANGEPFAKFVPHSNTPSVINLRDRPYFDRALRDDLQCLDASTPDDATGLCRGSRVAVDVVRSVASGKITLALARRTSLATPPDPDHDVVAGLILDVDDFKPPLLPLAFQLAVLDDQGLVSLHSAHDAHHGESFFDDVDDPRDLQATLAAGGKHAMDIRYAGVPSRAYIEPVPGVGWNVVTFAPKGLVDIPTTNLVVVTAVALALVVSALVVLGAVASVAWLVIPHKRGALGQFHLRPSGAFPEEYASFAWRGLKTTTLFCTLGVVSPPSFPRWLLLVLNVAAIFHFGWRLRLIQRPRHACPIDRPANASAGSACPWPMQGRSSPRPVSSSSHRPSRCS